MDDADVPGDEAVTPYAVSLLRDFKAQGTTKETTAPSSYLEHCQLRFPPSPGRRCQQNKALQLAIFVLGELLLAAERDAFLEAIG